MAETPEPQGIKDPLVRDAIEQIQVELRVDTTGEERILAKADGGWSSMSGATGPGVTGVTYPGLTGPTGRTGNIGPTQTGPTGPQGARGPTGP